LYYVGVFEIEEWLNIKRQISSSVSVGESIVSCFSVLLVSYLTSFFFLFVCCCCFYN